MRITFILQGYPWTPTGGAKVVYAYANQLVTRGHEVTVVHPRRLPNWTPPSPPGLHRRLRRKAGHLRNLLWTPRVEWQRIDSRVNLLYVPEPVPKRIPDGDAVVATWWPTAELVLRYPPGKGGKFHLIQGYEVWSGEEERVRAIWRTSLRKVVIAEWLYDMGLELGVRPEWMTYIPNGINHTKYRLVCPMKNRPRRVTMLCSDGEWKGAADGVKALELAKAAVPSLEAVLFGTRPRPIWLAQWIAYVRNPHQSALVEQIYNGSGIYLCPSWMEGWHLPPAEAMACGCAVVCTDIGGVGDYAVHEETALLSPPKDPEALARNLVRLLEDDDLRMRLAMAGHARIQEFEWERSARLLEGVLLENVQ